MDLTIFERAVVYKVRELGRVGFGKIEVHCHEGKLGITHSIPMRGINCQKYVERVEAKGTLTPIMLDKF